MFFFFFFILRFIISLSILIHALSQSDTDDDEDDSHQLEGATAITSLDSFGDGSFAPDTSLVSTSANASAATATFLDEPLIQLTPPSPMRTLFQYSIT